MTHTREENAADLAHEEAERASRPRLRVSLNNSAGELDYRIVTVPPDGEQTVQDAISEMIDGLELYDGDTITIRDEPS